MECCLQRWRCGNAGWCWKCSSVRPGVFRSEGRLTTIAQKRHSTSSLATKESTTLRERIPKGKNCATERDPVGSGHPALVGRQARSLVAVGVRGQRGKNPRRQRTLTPRMTKHRTNTRSPSRSQECPLYSAVPSPETTPLSSGHQQALAGNATSSNCHVSGMHARPTWRGDDLSWNSTRRARTTHLLVRLVHCPRNDAIRRLLTTRSQGPAGDSLFRRLGCFPSFYQPVPRGTWLCYQHADRCAYVPMRMYANVRKLLASSSQLAARSSATY